MRRIRQVLVSFLAIAWIINFGHFPISSSESLVSAQNAPTSSSNSVQDNQTNQDETTESGSDLPPEPPKDFESNESEQSSESSIDQSDSSIIGESSSTESSSTESSSTESSSETNSTSDTSNDETSNPGTTEGSVENDETNTVKTPVQQIIPGSLMIKPTNILEPVNIATTVRRIASYYGDLLNKHLRVFIPFAQKMIFPYGEAVIEPVNEQLINYLENILTIITN